MHDDMIDVKTTLCKVSPKAEHFIKVKYYLLGITQIDKNRTVLPSGFPNFTTTGKHLN